MWNTTCHVGAARAASGRAADRRAGGPRVHGGKGDVSRRPQMRGLAIIPTGESRLKPMPYMDLDASRGPEGKMG